MSDPWVPTTLPGVLRTSLTTHADERGSFTELFRVSLAPAGTPVFVQANLSRSKRGVLRGMHFHRRQSDLWIVVEGRAFVGLADLRAEGTPCLGLELGTGEAVLIPPHVAHGFYALEDLALLYLVTNEYDGTDELGFAWDDPAAAIAWPAGAPILSPRDRSNPSLAQVLAADTA
ncbi:MAG TPA: dTDP-4-dehydrorhamnose 3,5-epimerase family protein [Candidatus Limnocylindrales bacterium]|nr:dTDP-4-dehydrorhamnose 3,5-epimerase family protein [Candidatus Limnocylindrales bacterium]